MKEQEQPGAEWLKSIHRELRGSETDLSRNHDKSVKYYLREIHAQMRRILRNSYIREKEAQNKMQWALALVGFFALVLMANGSQTDPDISFIQKNWLALKAWGALLAVLFLSATLERSKLWSALWTLTSTRWICYVTFTAMLLVASGKAAALVNSVFAIDATLIPITYAFTTALTLFKLMLPWLFGLALCAVAMNIWDSVRGLCRFIRSDLASDFPWQSILFTLVGVIFGFQIYNWTNNELSDKQLTQKIYLIAQALDFNSRHDCINIPGESPVIFLGPTQQRVLVAPEAFEPFDFTTFFTAHVKVPDHFERAHCEFMTPAQR